MNTIYIYIEFLKNCEFLNKFLFYSYDHNNNNNKNNN